MSAIAASVVVPLYNDAPTIGQCLRSLLAQTIASRLEIIVVNDGSTDGGAQLAGAFPVTVVDQGNRGPAAARNAGVAAARGGVVVFLDADCSAPRAWAESMLARFTDPQIAAVVGAVESATGDMLAQLTQIEIEERYAQLARRRHVDFFAAVAVAIRRDVLVSIGGFREDFLHNEDVELAYRLHRAGARIVFSPEPRVLHPHPQRWRHYLETKFWRGVWRMRLYRLYPGKALRDDWTPQGLKLQLVAFCAAPAALAASFSHPSALWLVVALAALGALSGKSIIAGGLQRGGLRLAAMAFPFLVARAWALGAAIAYALVRPAWRRA